MIKTKKEGFLILEDDEIPLLSREEREKREKLERIANPVLNVSEHDWENPHLRSIRKEQLFIRGMYLDIRKFISGSIKYLSRLYSRIRTRRNYGE